MAASADFGPYRLLHTLGAGGMGQVFLARQRGEHEIQRLVAVKRILSHLARNERLINLFLDEVRVASQLTHGNIVQVVGHGQIDGHYYMAMEYVHGENLMETLVRINQQGQRMPLDLLLHIACCVCEGLDYAHRKEALDGRPLGIVHRDISPHNILISFQGQVKIADFGVARAAEQTHQTLGGELRGKISYMSPEQAYGRSLDQRSDLFSLGIVLYQGLSGESPFTRDNAMATLEAVRAAEHVPLERLRDDLPQEVIELVQHALQRDSELRPDSARSMHDAIQRIMRLHGLVVSPFDLADYLGDLFPESARRDPELRAVEGTAVGRRADQLSDAEVQERQTLYYLRQRHPQGTDVTAPSVGAITGEVLLPSRPRRWLPPLIGLALLAAGALTLRALIVDPPPQRRPGPVATSTPPTPAPAPDSARPAPPADAGGDTASRPARLAIGSLPSGAEVYVDGQRQALRTPLEISIGAGSHALRVALRGHGAWRRKIAIAPGERQTLRATLVPLESFLFVKSSHPCRVEIGRQKLGPTPLTRAVKPGELVVHCIDRVAGIRATRRVRARAGETTRLSFAFGGLAINLQPWASVSIDGKPRGTTPLRLLLPVGEHRVTLVNTQAGRRRSLAIEIDPRRPTRITSW